MVLVDVVADVIISSGELLQGRYRALLWLLMVLLLLLLMVLVLVLVLVL